jgi:phycobilisome rod-core linker protein
MSIPLLQYSPTTQNQRVEGYEVPNEDTPTIYRLADATSSQDVDQIIWAGYRQIFSEHLILDSYRQINLESQLRNRAINVRDFIRGLGKSDVYRTQVAESNSNYRLVDITLKRFLGRAAYNKAEEITWSIVIGTKGLHGFIDALLDANEYLENFGDDIVPFQRRRFQDKPFNLANPRYSDYWRDREILNLLGGRSYYQAQISGANKSIRIRSAIPASFFTLAGQIITDERNYQRSTAIALAQVAALKIPNTSHTDSQEIPTINPVPVSLPYRYIPSSQVN